MDLQFSPSLQTLPYIIIDRVVEPSFDFIKSLINIYGINYYIIKRLPTIKDKYTVEQIKNSKREC